MTVYETIYGLTGGFGLPSAADSGDCAGYNQNAGPRSTALGDGDDSVSYTHLTLQTKAEV